VQTCTYESYDDYIIINIAKGKILEHSKYGDTQRIIIIINSKYILVVKDLIDNYSVHQFALMLLFLYNKMYLGTLLKNKNYFYHIGFI